MALRWLIGCLLLVVTAGAAGCGGSDDAPSDAELRDRLLPASDVPGFKFHRGYIWTNATDLTVEGLHISQNTRPSDFIDTVEDAGFVKGAGADLQHGGPEGPGVAIAALKFESESGAEEVRDLLHDEYRKQPCYGVCSQVTHDMEVEGIPGARGEESVPDPNAGLGVPPGFEAYAVEFTVGPYLYVVGAGFGPGHSSKENALDAARALYERVKDRSD
jgi:hypothetical protein